MLNRNGIKYTDEEVKKIRIALYQLAEIEIQQQEK